LQELDAHCNYEWTFSSMHFAYLYSYLCKGVDTAGVKIRDATDEIAAFRSARVLTVAECVYRIMGYNVNYRSPAVIVCPIHLPRQHGGGGTCETPLGADDGCIENLDEFDEFGDHEAQQFRRGQRRQPGHVGDIVFAIDYVEHYFECPLRPDAMLFCEYFETYRRDRDRSTGIFRWIERRERILARMPWFAPWSGEIFFLRTLLWHIPARSFDDLYGGCCSFREHCIQLGLIENSDEYLYAIRDAIADGMSPAHCRHLFALCIATPDSLDVSSIWRDERIREYLRHDFIMPDTASDVPSPDEVQLCETLCLMDIAVMVQGMGVIDFTETLALKNLPRPPNVGVLSAQHDSLRSRGVRVFERYSSLAGYRVSSRTVVPPNEREVFRFLTTMPSLTEDQVAAKVRTLNQDQMRAFETILAAYDGMREGRQSSGGRLFNVDASAGCGKTYTMNRILEAIRLKGAITMSVCSIGIGALLFVDGRTVHSAFAIPIDEEKDILDGPAVVSRLEKVLDREPPNNTNARIEMIRATSFISWDEIGTINNHGVPCRGQVAPASHGIERTLRWQAGSYHGGLETDPSRGRLGSSSFLGRGRGGFREHLQHFGQSL